MLDDYPVDGTDVGRVPRLWQLSRSPRRRPAADRPGEPLTGSRSRSRPPICASRHRRASRQDRHHQEHGPVTGAAWVAWDGNYSFDATGAKIPVESLVMLSFPRAPLSGVLQFDATGTGTFDTAALRRRRPRRRPVRRRRRHRPADRAPLAARHDAVDGLRGVVEAPVGVGLRASRADPRDGRRDDAAVHATLARSVPPILRAEDVTVHDRGRRRHHPGRRRARPTSIICWSRPPSTSCS